MLRTLCFYGTPSLSKRWHWPDFSQAYADYEDVMKISEDLLSTMVLKLKGSYKIQYHAVRPQPETHCRPHLPRNHSAPMSTACYIPLIHIHIFSYAYPWSGSITLAD